MFSRDSLQTVNLTVSIVRGCEVRPISNVSRGNFRITYTELDSCASKTSNQVTRSLFSHNVIRKQPVQQIAVKTNDFIFFFMNIHNMT